MPDQSAHDSSREVARNLPADTQSRRRLRGSVSRILHTLFMGMIVGFCVVFAFLHELLRRCDQEQACHAIALGIGEGLAHDMQLNRPARRQPAENGESHWRAWLETRLHNPAILATEVLDSGGRNIAAVAQKPELLASLRSTCGAASAGPVLAVDHGSATGSNRMVSVRIPLPGSPATGEPAYIAALLKVDQPLAGGWRHSIAFYLPLLSMGLGCYMLVDRRLREQIKDPLSVLVNCATGKSDRPAITELARRPDELGMLAAMFDGLEGELEIWRDQAQRVERRMSSRLSEETRKITQDLNRVQREVWIDALTGVKNRRLLQERLPALFDAQRRAHKDLAVIMFDLDHFKVLNDSLGHWAGDELLAFTGELLRSCTRSEDVVARYGGDEFAVILPGAADEDAVRLAERVIAMFRQRAKMIASVHPTPSMTAGVASLHAHHPGSHLELLTLADKALYIAKRSGRSRAYCLARPEPAAAHA